MSGYVRRLLGLALACTGLASGCVMSAKAGEAQAVAAKDKAAAMALEALDRASKPGAYHEHLKALAGRFQQEIRWWIRPGSEPNISVGLAEVTVIMGGRYVKQQVQGEMAGEPFHGLGLIGYDNQKRKYVSIWIDNLSSGIMSGEGTCDRTGKVFTFVGSFADSVTGKQKTVRMVTRVVDADHQLFERYESRRDGEEFKTMEISSTRL